MGTPGGAGSAGGPGPHGPPGRGPGGDPIIIGGIDLSRRTIRGYSERIRDLALENPLIVGLVSEALYCRNISIGKHQDPILASLRKKPVTKT